jgi:hypothetical protein
MTTIRAYRERPITQPGQVERVLIKFGIGPDRGLFASASASDEEERRMFEEAAKNAVPTNFIPTAEQMKASEGRMCRDITEWPEHYVSTVSILEQSAAGGEIEMEIRLPIAEAGKIPQLIAELRGCGFVAGEADDYQDAKGE